MSDSEILRAVADRQAITEVIHRYCRAMDRIDPELGYSVWHEDGLAEYGDKIFRGTGRGFIDYVCAAHRNALHHHHQVSNIIIELNGDRAASETYIHSTMRMADGAKTRQIEFWGRYLDQWSRRNGRWAIDKRIYACDFAEVREVTPYTAPSIARRDRSDPSYAVFQTVS